MLIKKWFISTLFFALATPAAHGQSLNAPQILDIDFDLAKVSATKPMVGQTLTVDTRDAYTCSQIRQSLDPKKTNKRLDSLCEKNEARPYSTLVVLHNNDELASGVLYKFNQSEMKHTNNSRNVLILGLAVVGRFLAQGVEESNWEPLNGRDLPEAWWDHVSRAPVIDKDNFRTNFIEHPLSGAAYYSIARHSGFSAWESFGFSAFSSTFLWEYGLEAIFERPSINDLIVTPVIGSLIGEVFYKIHLKIEENNGRVFGSRTVGKFIQVITNPGFYLSEGLNEILGRDWFKEGEIGWVVRRQPNHQFIPLRSEDYANSISLRLRLKF